MLAERAIGDSEKPGAGGSGEESPVTRHRFYLIVKGVAEWCAAAVMLVVLAPLIGLLAGLVQLGSSGPAFYSQTRLGRYGKPFQIYKIRTMTHNCEASTGAVWSSGSSDPRVTRLGRVLRDTHLDELPQLWNVLRGEMSLIGPRPERPEIATNLERMLPGYSSRLLVLPGVTGLAQVQLPPDTDVESVRQKLAYDLHYVSQVNMVMDVRILVSTAFQITASSINAVGRGLVQSERSLVEKRGIESLKGAGVNTWRVGAA